MNGGGATVSIFGKTTNTTTSLQEANSKIAQTYTGICSIQCVAVTQNLSVVIIDSNISGGITISNECSVDSTCSINSSLQATNSADLAFFGAQSGIGVDQTPRFLQLDYSVIDVTNNYIYNEQRINLETTQDTYQSCDLVSSAALTDVTIYSQNSNIEGGITVANSASNAGACTLESSMLAQANSTALTDVNQFGSGTKAATKGSGKNKGAIWTWIAVIIGVLIIAYIVIAIIRSSTKKNKSKEEQIEMEQMNDAFVTGSEQPTPSSFMTGEGMPAGMSPSVQQFYTAPSIPTQYSMQAAGGPPGQMVPTSVPQPPAPQGVQPSSI